MRKGNRANIQIVARRLAFGLVATIAVCGFRGGLRTHAAARDDQDPAELASWVDRHIRQLQPTGSERRIDEIGWAKTIVEGERLAREHHRPIFLFTYDGSIDTGRC